MDVVLTCVSDLKLIYALYILVIYPKSWRDSICPNCFTVVTEGRKRYVNSFILMRKLHSCISALDHTHPVYSLKTSTKKKLSHWQSCDRGAHTLNHEVARFKGKPAQIKREMILRRLWQVSRNDCKSFSEKYFAYTCILLLLPYLL